MDRRARKAPGDCRLAESRIPSRQFPGTGAFQTYLVEAPLRLRRPNAMHHAGASVGLTSASTRSAPSLDSKFTCRDFEGFELHYVNQDFTLAIVTVS